MMQKPWRDVAKLAKRRVLVVNNSKNPAHDAKSLAKYNKVGEEAGSCCNHGKSPGGGYKVLLGVASSCILAPENHIDAPKTRCEEQTKCNSSLYLDRGVGVCFGKAAIIRPRAPPRDDKLQSIKCNTRHSTKFLSNDASGDGGRFAANRMKIDTTFTHTQAGFLTSACTKGV